MHLCAVMISLQVFAFIDEYFAYIAYVNYIEGDNSFQHKSQYLPEKFAHYSLARNFKHAILSPRKDYIYA